MPIQLPEALLRSDDYLELNEKQAYNLRARFEYIDEITEKITEWLEGRSSFETCDEFLNDLELDVIVNLSINTGDDHESNWLIHTSWGDGISERASLNKLPTDILVSLDADLPKLSASGTEVNAWLENNRDALRRALEALSCANNFSEVLSSVLALDILLAKLLAGVCKLGFR